MTDTSTVLVTGASSGIGRETALRYARMGSRLVLTARGPEALQATADECSAAGAVDVFTHLADIADGAEVQQLFDEAIRRYGRIDIVVQNASLAAFGAFLDVPEEVFERIIRSNVLGPANVARAALERFRRERGGQLVVVGSALGHAAVPYMSPYVVSKFAVTALVRILRQESRDLPGVSVHGIYPGAVDTPIYPNSANYFGRPAHVLPGNDSPAKMARAIVAATDRGRSSERQVGLANRPLIVSYRLFPRLFDRLVGPLMRLGSFTREQTGVTSGNAFEPSEANAADKMGRRHG